MGMRACLKAACVALAPLCALLPAELLSQEGASYGVKPQWWDSVKVEIVETSNARASYDRSVEKALSVGREKPKEWYVIGPFDSNDGDPWSIQYPIEKVPFNPRASYQGKSGKVEWQRWEDGKPCPIEGNADNSVFFFYFTLKSKTGGPMTLLMTSDDGCDVWFNKSLVNSCRNLRGMDESNPDSASVNVRANVNNEVLMKVFNNSGGWGGMAWLSSSNPMFVKIKIITEVLLKASKDYKDDPQLDKLAGEAAFLYERVKDWDNSLFWREWQFSVSSPKERRRCAREFIEMIRREPAAFPKAMASFERIWKSKDVDQETKAFFAGEMLNLMLDRNELNTMFRFLESNEAELAASMPKDLMKYKLRACIRKGDTKKANEIIKDIEQNYPDLKEDKELGQLKRTAESINASSIQLPVDWSFDAALRNLTKLEQSPVKLSLYNFIRTCLSEKGQFLLESDDPSRFHGALQDYKKVFAKYAEPYNESLKDYLALLHDKLGYSNESVERKRALLALGSVEVARGGSPERVEPVQSLPRVQKSFQPLVEMNPGGVEFMADELYIPEKFRKSPPAYAYASGNKLFLQNSREVLCYEGFNLLWRRLFSLSSIQGVAVDEGNLVYPLVISGPLKPCGDGKMAFARILDKGIFSIYAFRADNGATVWTAGGKSMTFCSNPKVWRDKIVAIAKMPDSIPRYSLVMLNPKTGKVELNMFLFATPELTPFGHNWGNIELDIFMPDPSIFDDIAYINTNAGVVFAVDLLTESMLWARKYPRTPFSVSAELSKAVGDKKFVSPIIGRTTVLFAPIDSIGLLLLKRETGELVVEKTGVPWTDMAPCGEPASAVFAFTQTGISLLDVVTLDAIRSIPLKGASCLGFSNDNLLLSTPDSVALMDRGLKSVQSTPIPEEFQPILVLKDRIYGYQTDSVSPVVGVLTSQPVLSQKDFKRPLPERQLGILENPFIWQTGSDTYLVAENCVARLGRELKTDWVFPWPRTRQCVSQGKDTVFLFTERRIYVLDKEKGTLLNMFPSYDPQGSSLPKLFAPSVSGDSILFAANFPGVWDKVSICSLSAKEFKNIASFNTSADNASVQAIFNEGKTVLAINNKAKNFTFYALDSKGVSYAKTDKQFGGNINGWDARRFNFDERTSILKASRDEFVYIARADMSSVKLEYKKGRGNNWRFGRNIYEDVKIMKDVFATRFYENITTIDVARNRDLSTNLELDEFPFLLNDNIMGAGKNNNSKQPYKLQSYNLKDGKTASAMTDFAGTSLEHTFARYRFGMEADGKIFHLFGPSRGGEKSNEGCLVGQAPGSSALQYLPFPESADCSGAVCKDNFVMLILGGLTYRMGKEEFFSLKDGAKHIFESLKQPLDFVPDGYPDEWREEKFNKIGKNSFQVVLGKDKFWIGGFIGDEKLLEKTGYAIGPDWGFIVLPGSAACLRTDNYEIAGYSSRFVTDKELPFKFGCSASPAGDYLFFEMEIPYEMAFRFGYNEAVFKSVDSRKLRGDMAFEIFLDDEDGNRTHIFSGKELPAFFPRVMFPIQEQQKQPPPKKK